MNPGRPRFVDVTCERPLAAVAHALVGDVANVVRIETLGPTPLIIDGFTNPQPTLKRTLMAYRLSYDEGVRDSLC
jgi:hypothetical protein